MEDREFLELEKFKKILFEEDYKLILVKKGEIIYSSKDRGILPIYELAERFEPDDLRGSYLFDRVIGRGAGILAGYLSVDYVYGELMSNSAIEILEKANINYEYDRLCDNILNRDKTGLCPVESLSLKTSDSEELLEELKIFLNK